MFDSTDSKYLHRRLARNEVILFLGAGFSRHATNRLGDSMPLSGDLSAAIWEFLGYTGDYDGTALPSMYEAMLQSGEPYRAIQEFLEQRLMAVDVPGVYDAITLPFWHRIYTTSVDNVLATVYSRSTGPSLDAHSFPNDEPRERDQALDRIQGVYLHGRLPCSPDDITFSVSQYARRSGKTSPLYEQFVGDYATWPTIFVGTELSEQLFWQHVETRMERDDRFSEHRPRSFLVAPRISPPKRSQLRPYNVIPVEGEAKDFLQWLTQIKADLPSRTEVLRHTLPTVVQLFESTQVSAEAEPDIKAFGEAFHLIPTAVPSRGDRSFFLMGATPRWEDILSNLDAPREVTQNLFDRIEEELTREENPRVRVIALLGSAGCGKSTILRRLGVQLSRNGRMTFLTNSEELPRGQTMVAALNQFERRAVLLFDNAEVALSRIPELVDELCHLPYPPVMVIASRLNDYDRRGSRLEETIEVEEVDVPRLMRSEVLGIIAVLEEEGLLGRLKGMSQRERIDEFESREKAGKQLLVAMREATSGKGFDEIIEDEFYSLPSRETKVLYLTVALATDAGYRISKQEVVRASKASPAETLDALERNLRGIVLKTGTHENLLLLRHRTIAEHVLNEAVARTLLAESYERLLPVLAEEAGGRGYRSRSFRMYRDLVNHKTVFRRFEEDIEEARSIYESVASQFRTEAAFWHQYGLLELEFGNLELAENYLLQAQSLFPKSNYIANSIGHLYLKQSNAVRSETVAYELRRRGSEILEDQMRVDDSPYPYHIYCAQRLRFSKKWLTKRDDRKGELEHLRKVAEEGRRGYPRSRRLKSIKEKVDREYLRLAVK